MNETLFNYMIDKVRRFHLSPSNRLSHVCSYVRELPINLDRMYENALDGEHLPYLHQSTFSRIKILKSGSWGWRAKVSMQPRSRLTDMVVQLVLNRDENCWKTTTLSGLGKGTEIWTHAIPIDDNKIKIVVNFYVPKMPLFLKKTYADFYKTVYERLYDEDLMMMSQRQEALDYRQQSSKGRHKKNINLGPEKEVRARLPFVFEFNHNRFCLNQVDGKLLAYAASCPHMLGPLDESQLRNGTVECPWHGYRFDVTTGQCVNGHNCRLKTPPTITVDDKGNVIANATIISDASIVEEPSSDK